MCGDGFEFSADHDSGRDSGRITHAAPEPGPRPFSCAVRGAVRFCQAEVTTRANGNPVGRSRSGGVNSSKRFPMSGSGERRRYAAFVGVAEFAMPASTLFLEAIPLN